jgi:hypothetical protein
MWMQHGRADGSTHRAKAAAVAQLAKPPLVQGVHPTRVQGLHSIPARTAICGLHSVARSLHSFGAEQSDYDRRRCTDFDGQHIPHARSDMQSAYRPDGVAEDPWMEESHGEAYAREPFQQSGGYGPALVSPWLINRFSVAPMLIDGHPSLEVGLEIIRDYDTAANVCPHEGYDLLGWHNAVSVAVRSDRAGRWASFTPSVGAFQPQPPGDGATVDLGYYEVSASWRFIPEALGAIQLWAFVFINGAYVPFDEMMASAHYIDTNGAARLDTLL